MPTARALQTSFASGDLDPLLWSREDISFFYSTARLIENVVPLPQGGGKRREGWRARQRQRGLVAQAVITGWNVTTPSGGSITATALLTPPHGTLTTTAAAFVAPQVIVRVDMLAAGRVSLFEIQSIRLISGTLTQARVGLQTSPDDVTWTTQAEINVGTTAYARRFALRPGSDIATARYVRLAVLDSAAGSHQIELIGFRPMVETGWAQGGVPGNFKTRSLTASITDEYGLIFTQGGCDIIRQDTGAFVASVTLPYTDAAIPDLKFASNLDTLLVFHRDFPVQTVQRLGSDADWRSGAAVFESVPRFPFQTPPISGGLDEQQVYEFAAMASGNRVAVEYNGQVSAEVIWNVSETINIANLQTVINGLDDISGVTVTVESGTSVNARLRVTFSGVDGKRTWPGLIISMLSGTGTATMRRKQYGRPDTDDLWSATRGYPSCGAFYQGRLWLGGFRSRPGAIAVSRAGALFDFKADADPVAASPILVEANADDQVVIQHMYAGRHLQIFTSSAELYVPSEPITIDNIALKITTRHGAWSETLPFDIQGGTLFVDRNGRAVREYLFVDTEQSYSAEPISIMHGHLIARPRSMTLRRAQNVDEPTVVLLANTATDVQGDPVPAAAVVIDRAQQVTGFFRIKTDGTVLDFMASQGGEAFAVVSRSLAGVPWNYIEQFDRDFMSDAGIKVANPNLEEFTATAGQTDFVYSFTSPPAASGLSVWRRDGANWRRLGSSELLVNLGTKTVTLAPQAAGQLIRIALRADTITIPADNAPLFGQTLYVHVDGRPMGEIAAVGNTITIENDLFDFEAEIGLRQVPRIVMHPYKGRGEASPTMRKQRIHTALFQLENTASIAVGIAGKPLKPIALQNYDQALFDATLDELLFSGPVRVSGLQGWKLEPSIEISQLDPMPFTLRSVTYDVRF